MHDGVSTGLLHTYFHDLLTAVRGCIALHKARLAVCNIARLVATRAPEVLVVWCHSQIQSHLLPEELLQQAIRGGVSQTLNKPLPP